MTKMPNYISENFTRAEFACKCGCGFDRIDFRLVEWLQEIRDALGKPVVVSSGCRCRKHNERVGGSPKSQHVEGKAADIHSPGVSLKDLYRLAESNDKAAEGGIGLYPQNGFIHVDVRGYKARWGWIGGKQTSIAEALRRLK